MMYISRVNLAKFLDTLVEENSLVAPRNVDGVLLYQPVDQSDQIVWDFARPVMSVKDVFFPSTERLLTVEINKGSFKLQENIPGGRTVVFGVRPCDARGMEVLDALFLETEPVDTYYAARRQNTTMIGLACKEMGETCFCTSVGGAPDDKTGMDVMLTESGEGYIVEPLTDKGDSLVSSLSLEEAPGGQTHPASAQPIPVPPLETWPSFFNADYWETVSERCISCRICSYVCPTCRCFDVRDEELPAANGHTRSERIRCWDSCAGNVYRRIAGGHNPREAKADRSRNRMFCKFYYYSKQYGPTACTGCGRCIDACPVNIDVTEILGHLAEAEA
jgi:ferredoxin